MLKLILLGEGSGQATEQFLIANLKKRVSMVCCTEYVLSAPESDANFLLLSAPRLIRAELPGALYLMKDGARLPKNLTMSSDATVIVSSDEEHQLQTLAGLGVKTITCGLSCKDTITFSSKSDEAAVVSLMREVESVTGEILEPLDIPITFPAGCADYPLLACTATLLLTGILSQSENGNQAKYYQS